MRYLMTKKKAEKMVKIIGNKYFNEGAEIKINFIDNARLLEGTINVGSKYSYK